MSVLFGFLIASASHDLWVASSPCTLSVRPSMKSEV